MDIKLERLSILKIKSQLVFSIAKIVQENFTVAIVKI